MTNYGVGIPVRNEPNTLEACINSVLAQSSLLPQDIKKTIVATTPCT